MRCHKIEFEVLMGSSARVATFASQKAAEDFVQQARDQKLVQLRTKDNLHIDQVETIRTTLSF